MGVRKRKTQCAGYARRKSCRQVFGQGFDSPRLHQKKAQANCLCFLLVYVEAGGERTPKGRPPNGKSQPLGFFRRTPRRKADAPPRKRTPLASTKAESDELLLLAFGLCGKGKDLRTQKFCHLLMGVAIFVSEHTISNLFYG